MSKLEDGGDGGTAFPTTDRVETHRLVGGITHAAGSNREFESHAGYPGMSLRDYFAGQALVGIMQQIGVGLVEDTDPMRALRGVQNSAEVCYLVANAMLEARKQ